MVDIVIQTSECLRRGNDATDDFALVPRGGTSLSPAGARGHRVLLEVSQHAFANEMSANLGRVDESGSVFEVSLAKVATKSVRIGKQPVNRNFN